MTQIREEHHPNIQMALACGSFVALMPVYYLIGVIAGSWQINGVGAAVILGALIYLVGVAYINRATDNFRRWDYGLSENDKLIGYMVITISVVLGFFVLVVIAAAKEVFRGQL